MKAPLLGAPTETRKTARSHKRRGADPHRDAVRVTRALLLLLLRRLVVMIILALLVGEP